MTARSVLVTGCSGPAGRALVRQLAARHIAVIGVDAAPDPVDGVTIVPVPRADDPDFVAVLRGVALDHSVDLVIPTVSEELPVLASSVLGFPLDGRVAIGSRAAVALADDKLLTARRLRAHGIRVPRFAVPSGLPGLAAAFAVLGSPFIAKPRVSRGGRGVVVVRSSADLDWSSLDDSWILQEFASGEEYAPVLVRDPAFIAPTVVVVLAKTGLAGGEIGNATGVRRVDGSEAGDVRRSALHAAIALGLTGPADIDVRRLADGTPVVLEVNARFGANSEAAPELLERILRLTVADRGANRRREVAA